MPNQTLQAARSATRGSHYDNDSDSPVEAQQGEILQRLDSCVYQFREACGVFERLEERLRPVLRRDFEEKVPVNAKAEIPMNSPVAITMLDHSSQIGDLIARMHNIIDRLEV